MANTTTSVVKVGEKKCKPFIIEVMVFVRNRVLRLRSAFEQGNRTRQVQIEI